jgi:hypothetical protein
MCCTLRSVAQVSLFLKLVKAIGNIKTNIMYLSELVEINNAIKSIEKRLNDFENIWKTTEGLVEMDIDHQLVSIIIFLNDRKTSSSLSKVSKTSRNNNISAEIDAKEAVSLNKSLK